MSCIIRFQLMTVERIHPKAPVMLIFIAIFTCLPSCINLSNINKVPYICCAFNTTSKFYISTHLSSHFNSKE